MHGWSGGCPGVLTGQHAASIGSSLVAKVHLSTDMHVEWLFGCEHFLNSNMQSICCTKVAVLSSSCSWPLWQCSCLAVTAFATRGRVSWCFQGDACLTQSDERATTATLQLVNLLPFSPADQSCNLLDKILSLEACIPCPLCNGPEVGIGCFQALKAT